MQLDNKVAILTGASSGLGSAIAKALILKRVEVYGLARNVEALNKLEAQLGKKFHVVKMDISDAKAVKSWVKKTFSKDNAPDILINNAGIGSFGKVDEIDENVWLNMVNVNLNGMYFLTSSVVPLLKANKNHTHIINIGSILGTVAKSEGAAYCTTKFGVSGFSESLFKELRFFNIKVSCINPGSIDTDFFKSSGIEAHHNMIQPKDLANTIIHVLETPDNMLINELTVRPLDPRVPTDK